MISCNVDILKRSEPYYNSSSSGSVPVTSSYYTEKGAGKLVCMSNPVHEVKRSYYAQRCQRMSCHGRSSTSPHPSAWLVGKRL